MSGLSALCEFTHHSISRLQRKSGLTGRTAASRRVGQWPVWAVHVGRGEIVWQDRCDAANGSKEPTAEVPKSCGMRSISVTIMDLP